MRNHLTQAILNLSIRHKILFIVMLTCGISLFCTFGLFMVYNSIKLRSSMVQELEVLAEVIGNRSTAALLYADRSTAEENLKAFSARRSIMLACIYDNREKVFAVYHHPQAEQHLCPTSPPSGHIFTDSDLSLYSQIRMDEEVVGSLFILSNLKDIRESFIQYTSYALLSILTGSVIAFLVSTRLLRLILNPITSLVRTANIVTRDHNYTVRAEKVTNDELGTLVDVFNDMMHQVDVRDKAVIAAKESLEQRVKERTQELRASKETAEAANRSKSIFLANMSHELRTPMHAVLSYSDFGMQEMDEAPKEDLTKYFKRIHESGTRLLSLLNNLLDLSKLEVGKMEFDIHQNNLRKPLDTVVRELQSLLAEKHLELEIIEPNFEPIALFDMGKIIQVIHNIIGNAIKFTPDGKKITVLIERVSYKHDDKTVPGIALHVSDQGIGIPDDEFDKIFDKFVQSSKTKTGAGGTGLGLAICYEIIKAHDGVISCRNNEEGSAVFTFILPVP